MVLLNYLSKAELVLMCWELSNQRSFFYNNATTLSLAHRKIIYLLVHLYEIVDPYNDGSLYGCRLHTHSEREPPTIIVLGLSGVIITCHLALPLAHTVCAAHRGSWPRSTVVVGGQREGFEVVSRAMNTWYEHALRGPGSMG